MELVDIYTGELVERPFQTTRFIRPSGDGEPGDPRTITEQSFIPADQLIKDMQEAGVMLSESRKLRFSKTFQSEVLGLKEGEEPDLDPTRQPGFDLVDAGEIATRVRTAKEKSDLIKAEATRQAAEKAQQAIIDRAVHDELERRASASAEASLQAKKDAQQTR